MRKILILSILIMFLFSITPAFADIWWTGTPDFVVNETADWDSVKVNTTTITDRYNQTANNIQADFPYASKHNNLTHFFRFDKASTTFVNETGGTASCTACPDYTALGKFDSGYDFEATNLDFISLGARPKPNNYTISIWIKPEGWLNSGLVHSIISAGDGNTMWGLLAYDTGDLLTLVVSTGSASQLCQIDVWDSTDTPNSVFTNYIGTANGTDLTIYKNGVVIQNCARTVWSAGTGYGISIGEIGDYDGASNYHYDGIMDEVKMYNESLTQYEVQELYNNGKRYIDTAWAGSNSIWTSDTQTVTAGNKLKNVTINLTSSATGYIDAVYFYNSTGTLVATNETNIITTGLINYSTALGLDTGSFDYLNETETFNITVKFAGDGTTTPKVDDIIGYYEDGVGETIVWQGKTSTDWNVGSNWNTSTVPGIINPVILNAIPANQSVLTANSNAYNISIPYGASLNTSGYNLQVGDDISVSGLLNVSGGKLIMNGDSDGDCELNIRDGGTMYLLNSGNVTNGAADSANYQFYIADGSNMSANDSYIRKAGWEDVNYHRGVDVYSDSVNMNNMTISGMDYIGLYFSDSNNGIYNNITITSTDNAVFLNSSSNSNKFINSTLISSSDYVIYIGNSNSTNFTTSSISGSSGIFINSGNYNFFKGMAAGVTNNALYYKGSDSIFRNSNFTGSTNQLNSDGGNNSFINSNFTGTVSDALYVYSTSGNNSIYNATFSSDIGAGDYDIEFDTSGNNLTLVNCSFNANKIAWTSSTSYLFVKYYIDVHMMNSSDSNNTLNANVTMKDVFDSQLFNENTSSTGYTSVYEILAYKQNGTLTGNITSYDLHNISATADHYNANSTTYNVTAQKSSTAELYLTTATPGFTINNLYWLRTYQSDNYSRSFFTEKETVRIITNLSGTIVEGQLYPRISVYYPNGTMVVNQFDMTNYSTGTSGIYYYDYDINTSEIGYYNVSIGTKSITNAFYSGYRWQDNWTNSSGIIYPFEINLTVNNSAGSERHWEVIDKYINFSSGAHENSVRVCLYNGTDLIEIPSQVYNKTESAGVISYANVVFLSSLNETQSRSYNLYYKKSDTGAMNYSTDLNYTNHTGYYTFENKNYKIQTNKTFGGLMYSAYNKLGSNTNLSGLNPMQSMPEVRYDELTLCSMKDYSSPQITVENGPMFTRYVASGKMGTCGINYNLTYIFYSNSPYFSVETKVAPTDARTWFDYRDQRLIIKDSKFDNVTIRNSTGVFEQLVISGDGTEWTNQGDLKWIGLYNKTSKDSIGDVFVNRLQLTVSTPDVDFTDSSSYEYYTRTIIENYNVIISDYFYSKIARTLWDSSDGYSELNSIYNQTSNISVVTASATSVYDTEAPKFNESDERLNYRPQTPADTNDITCYSFWTDNLEMDYVIVRENATGSFRDHTVSLTGNTSGWANYTINNTDIETGNITCNFTGYDIASLSNSTNFTFHVSDTTHPNITNISYVPTTTADLDPNVQINVSVNVTDYGTIDTVILQNRTNDTGNWTNTTMRLLSGNLYNASFTPIQEANHTIRIIANDTLNNVNISSSQNITVGYDRVWYLIPSDFGEVPILIDATKNAVNLTINNTGDYDMNFSISTNYPSGQTFYNVTHSTKINVNNLSFTVVQVNFTAQNTPQSNAITITVTANETTQNSTSQISTGTLVTIPPGPYLYTEFITYPSSIVGSNQTNLSVKITNHGNETATDAWVAYTLPTGWTNISGALNKTLGNMGENEIAWNNITVNVTTLASTGDQTIFVESNSSTGGYNNDSVTVTIIGVTVVATTVETISSTGGGGGGGGGMSVGGSSDKLFQTSEIFEMIRGEYSSFPLTIENPFTNSTMENVTIKVTGLLSKYVTVFPEKLSKLSPKNSYNFTIKINAPSYFTTGDHKLVFTIRSKLREPSGTVTDMIEDRSVTLAVHEVSRVTAIDYIDTVNNILKEMIDKNFYTNDIKSLITKAMTAYEDRNYEEVQSIYEQIKDIQTNALTSQDLIDQMSDSAFDAVNSWGLKTEQTERIINLAKLAFQRGDYATALERIKEAQMTFALETKGEYNIPFILTFYWKYVILATVGLLFVSFLLFKRIKLAILNFRIKSLTREEQILLGLMKVIQKDTFEHGKMSIGEYGGAMLEYEKRLNEVVKDIIRFETERAHLFKLGGKEQELLDERNRLLGLIKKTQSEYMTQGKYEVRIYTNKMQSYSERFSEIQENLAVLEAKHALNKNSIIEKIGKRIGNTFK